MKKTLKEKHNSARKTDAFIFKQSSKKSGTILLAGNPNAGKSTVFNGITGLHQHTGNWTGKTVDNAFGHFNIEGEKYVVVDTPGTYSLFAGSEEETIARDMICFGSGDITVIVCDATCMERNLYLALQIMACGKPVVLCVNLLDEARKKGIKINLDCLERELGVPIAGTVAKKRKSLVSLLQKAQAQVLSSGVCSEKTLSFADNRIYKLYLPKVKEAIMDVSHLLSFYFSPNNQNNHKKELELPSVQTENKAKGEDVALDENKTHGESVAQGKADAQCDNLTAEEDLTPAKVEGLCPTCDITFLAQLLLESDQANRVHILGQLGIDYTNAAFLLESIHEIREKLKAECNLDISDYFSSAFYDESARICSLIFSEHGCGYSKRDLLADRVLTNPKTGFPLMLLMLALVLWITVSGANYPSSLLSSCFSKLESYLYLQSLSLHIPPLIYEPLIFGVFRVLSWVISVMLPPMAIFFPLFTLLEDFGLLPRIAFNLDNSFKKCASCGKQGLTMCMGLGCNAAGVMGCRIISGKNERLVSIITNSLVPCNGKFPAIVTVGILFFSLQLGGLGDSAVSTAVLVAVILSGIFATMLCSKFLSKTFLKNGKSVFILELPPYRKPQVGRTVLRSIFDRTLFVLGRAAIVAAPAGLVIWIFANTYAGGVSLLSLASDFLDPAARLIGLDGVILLAFILGLPANEIVLPLAIMCYMSSGTLTELSDLASVRELLYANGWTVLTAICFITFSLFHWPCSTTCITIYRETKSLKWTLLSVALPTLFGISLCLVISVVSRVLTLI